MELLAAITAMFDAFQLVDTKSMSAELKQKDEERDNQLRRQMRHTRRKNPRKRN